ncbi:hypothetical protein EC988_000067 [Linderina pennispora]|nr:hypothetical protein EC988_000067 [Linderina pennispora]
MTAAHLSIENLNTQALVGSIPFVDHAVHHESLFDDSKALLVKVFPEWTGDELEMKQCKDGITNKLIQSTNRRTGVTVLIRAYGKHTEVIIDRDQELINMAGLTHLGMCPPLYARFQNGLVYGFIPGSVAKPEEMGNSVMAPLIARELAKWHQIKLPGAHTPELFSTITRWLHDVPQQYADPTADAKFQKHFSHDKLAKEIRELEGVLTKLESPVVFSHNDLLSGNVIINDSKDSVSFIDYEYATYSYRGFDIANHFCEYAGFECDYSRYPSKERQIEWFRTYLAASGADASDQVLEGMYVEVSRFALASHVYWGVWGLVQASISDIDFDYMEYAKMRFDEYYRIKAQLL